MDPLIPFVAPGVLVAVDYVRRRRAGRDPLGPRPEGELPDTALPLVVAMSLWLVAQNGSSWLLEQTGAGTNRVRTFMWTTINVVVAVAFLRAATRGPRRGSLPAWKLVAAGALGALVVFSAQALVGAALLQAYASFGEELPGQAVAQEAKLARGAELVVAAAGALVMAPFAEEVFYRGLLLPAVSRFRGERVGLALQAVAFGASHVVGAPRTWPLAIPLAIVGWGAGWFYLRTGSLAVPIVLHAVFNAINFAALRAVA